jgi:hypothetical protein
MATTNTQLLAALTAIGARLDALEAVATEPTRTADLMPEPINLETIGSTLVTLLDGVPMKGRQSGLKWKYCAYHHETGIIANLQKYFPEATSRAVHDVLVAKVKSGEIQVDEWWTIRTAKMIAKARKRTAPFTHKVETKAFVRHYASK